MRLKWFWLACLTFVLAGSARAEHAPGVSDGHYAGPNSGSDGQANPCGLDRPNGYATTSPSFDPAQSIASVPNVVSPQVQVSGGQLVGPGGLPKIPVPKTADDDKSSKKSD